VCIDRYRRTALGQYYEGTSFKYPGEVTLITKEGKAGTSSYLPPSISRSIERHAHSFARSLVRTCIHVARVQCARVAFDEALAFLQSAKPVRQLALSAGLTAASQDHVGDHFTKNLVGTTGSDGADSLSRANRYGEWSLLCGESIGYGGRLRTHTHAATTAARWKLAFTHYSRYRFMCGAIAGPLRRGRPVPRTRCFDHR